MLSSLFSQVIFSLLSALMGWLVRHFQEIIKDKNQAAVDMAKIAAAQKALEDAKTKEDLDNAAKGIADNF